MVTVCMIIMMAGHDKKSRRDFLSLALMLGGMSYLA